MSIDLINTTPYGAFGFEHVLFHGRRYYIAIVKQSWQLMPGGGMRLLDEQRPVRVGDRFQGRADYSAIDLPTDLIPHKPQPELILCGHAQSAVPKTQWDATVAIGDSAQWHKTLRVFGPRWFKRGLLGWQQQDTEPTTRARLDYAGAYGGHFELPPTQEGEEPLVVRCAENPGGRAWLGSGHGHKLTKAQRQALETLQEPAQVLAPCIEEPSWLSPLRAPGKAMPVVAFGALPAWSVQRMKRLKGLKLPKDPAELKGGYPENFNMSHWQQASSDQWLPMDKEALPGTWLTTRGVFEEGDARWRIPRPQGLLYVRSQKVLNATLKTDIDTLVLDVDARVLEVIERRLVSLEEFGEALVIEVLQRQYANTTPNANATSAAGA